ncbi:MAG: rhodanese-like domain-containing protein [Candidatus Sulfobium sp.]|jgi:thiosulfate/3-mercaptopyruvate sulfurtransferase
MKRHLIKTIMLALLVAATALVSAPAVAAAGTPKLVSTEWLAGHLGAPDMLIIDVRTAANYDFGHLPGAVSLAYSGWEPYNKKIGCQLMPTPADLTSMLRKLGVNDSTHVVVYDQGNTALDASEGGAVVWILESVGHENVSYLDGGFTKWTFEGRRITKEKPTPQPGNFTARLDPTKVATLKDVIANLKTKEAIFLDDRTAVEHFGVEKRGDVVRYGHIPGSLNFPLDFMTNAGINRAPATIRSLKELNAMAAGVGLPKDKNRKIIVYCNSAQQAGMGYFVLHDVMGYRNVKTYDGSMLEYAQDKKLPLARFSWGFVTK